MIKDIRELKEVAGSWKELIEESSAKMRMLMGFPDRVINVIGEEEE